ncbi:HupE/UreJ family protein [Methylibium sp.]|uniref:HupE/UreJ family protein n=1 Tax=Methylibium sp. TaxID=2067992 RepID=UPI003D128ECE
MSKSTSLRCALAGALLMVASVSQAHTGHGVHGLADGLAHPFMGLDHLLAMVAVGLWSAAVLPAGRRLLGPGTFVAMLPVGALLAWGGMQLPAVESGVALSVVLLGAMLLAGRRMPASLGLAVTGVAALFHGYAHGSELAVGASAAAYAAGFMFASVLLHGAGIAAGAGLLRLPARAGQLAAAVVGGAGMALLAARL